MTRPGWTQTPNYTIFGRLDTASRDVVATMAATVRTAATATAPGGPTIRAEILTAKKG